MTGDEGGIPPPDAIRRDWNRRYRTDRPPDQHAWILEAAESYLPHTGFALDIAGGAGRNALWLAARGLSVTLTDISDAALEIAAGRARGAGLTLVTRRLDLERRPLPPGPWDAVLVVHYLQRNLLTRLADHLLPSGVAVVLIATRRNLERHERPGAEYLLEEGEAPGLLRGLDTLYYEEGWSREGRHEAAVIARRSTHRSNP